MAAMATTAASVASRGPPVPHADLLGGGAAHRVPSLGRSDHRHPSEAPSAASRPHSIGRRVQAPGDTGVAVAAGRSLIGAGSGSSSRPSSLSRPPLVGLAASPEAKAEIPCRGGDCARRPEDSLEELMEAAPRNAQECSVGPARHMYPGAAGTVLGAGVKASNSGTIRPDARSSLPSSSLTGSAASRGRPGRPPIGNAGSVGGTGLDYDEEARKLWSRLNLDPAVVSSGPYNAMDALWRHSESKGIFFVGNQTAASTLSLLQRQRVTHVVNCTDSMPFYHDNPQGHGPIRYFRFDITSHYRKVRSDADAVSFVQPMLDFVGGALNCGHNVMVHCLAGAHRAGTTGIICLMHFAGLPPNEAILAAKKMRPIIDPIGDFPELVAKLDRGWKAMGRRAG